jgi:multiple antibiotic resistance protein
MFLNFIQVFFAIFGVMDPVGNVPLFLTLTGKMDKKTCQVMARRAIFWAGIILIIFVFFGNLVLDVFSIPMESLRIAGGILLILLGFQVLFGISFTPTDSPDGGGEDISIVPLATPFIAGPGMMSLAIILTKEYGYLLTILGIAANLLLSLILFRYADYILRILGKNGTHAFAKIMGFILVAIGVEFIRSTILL